jgi:hypothetical protein
MRRRGKTSGGVPRIKRKEKTAALERWSLLGIDSKTSMIENGRGVHPGTTG